MEVGTRGGLGVVVAVLVLVACTPAEEAVPPVVTASIGVAAATEADREPGRVFLAMSRDGDSFVGSDGVEYRIGLINTPELGECGGEDARHRTEELLADGFVPDPYTDDDRGRVVARITTPDGDLGVILASEGYADDRYLEEFRHENPAYAAELDAAFRRARQARAGFHATCWADDTASARPPTGGHQGRTGDWACHPAYVECLPVLDDLDCADVAHRVGLFSDADPYRLDGNSTTATDGIGCDTYPDWQANAPYPYYQLGG